MCKPKIMTKKREKRLEKMVNLVELNKFTSKTLKRDPLDPVPSQFHIELSSDLFCT